MSNIFFKTLFRYVPSLRLSGLLVEICTGLKPDVTKWNRAYGSANEPKECNGEAVADA